MAIQPTTADAAQHPKHSILDSIAKLFGWASKAATVGHDLSPLAHDLKDLVDKHTSKPISGGGMSPGQPHV